MRSIEVDDVGAFVRDVLLNPARDKPVVAVTTRSRTGSTWLDPQPLAAALGELAEVVCLETGDPTWELTHALPPRLDVYGGAVRIWWPGLRADSNPYDHRLYFIRSSDEARAVFDEIVTNVRRAAPKQPSQPIVPVDAVIESVAGTEVELSCDGQRGALRDSDIPLAELVRCLEAGTRLRVRPMRQLEDGRWEFSCRELLPRPWQTAAAALAVGDVVRGRVQSTRDFGAFVDVLPQVTGLVHISELDWSFVDDVAEHVRPGQLVLVKILAFNAEAQKLELSIKRAYGTSPSELPSLVPHGVPFAWAEDEAPSSIDESADHLIARTTALNDELDAVVADRARLAEANKQLREQVQELKKLVRGAEDRLAALKQRVASELDPLDSETGFLLGVRLAYARIFDEGDRQVYPLRRMRVGPGFLPSLRVLEGIDLQKVLDVCAQVAANAAHTLVSREVHQLRDGPRGAPSRTRASDQAQAWRCSLQVHTPSARRLHWWSVPGDSEETIEFANVVLHDDYDITE